MRHHHTTNDDDFEIINGRKCLKDGHRYRVPVTMRDSAPKPLITDGHGKSGLALHKPGFRCLLDDDAGAHAKERAYRQYENQLCDAYKGDAPPAGAYPYTAAAEGQSCTLNGMPGTLVREGNWLVCTPTKQDADIAAYSKPDEDEDDEDDKEEQEEDERPPRRRRRWQQFDPKGRAAGTVTEEDARRGMHDHQSNMDAIYSGYDDELRNAFRRGQS